MKDKIVKSLNKKLAKIQDFSGSVLIKKSNEIIFQKAYGFADIANERENNIDTRFGVASGAKLFTSIGICTLVDEGKLTFDTYLKDVFDLGLHDQITIRNLLTHTSGAPDYFDEEVISDFSEIFKDTPMYLLKEPKDFIPLINKEKAKFNPGERFKYNNAGMVILALIIEKLSGMSFTKFIEKRVLAKAGMQNSGYFSLDTLPKNCAFGYIETGDGNLKTNIYSIPIVGGGDGGIFLTAGDMSMLWNKLLNYQLLSENTTKELLFPHAYVDNKAYYGYGIWMIKEDDKIHRYFITGSDPGVDFSSSYYPEEKIEVTVLCNKEFGAWDVTGVVEALLIRGEYYD